MADKSKNFGNKVANFGKKFIGGLLFDDLPEAAEVSEADRLEYPLHDTQDYKSCIEFGTIQEEGVDLEGLIGFGSLFGKNETIEDESDEDENNEDENKVDGGDHNDTKMESMLRKKEETDTWIVEKAINGSKTNEKLSLEIAELRKRVDNLEKILKKISEALN